MDGLFEYPAPVPTQRFDASPLDANLNQFFNFESFGTELSDTTASLNDFSDPSLFSGDASVQNGVNDLAMEGLQSMKPPSHDYTSYKQQTGIPVGSLGALYDLPAHSNAPTPTSLNVQDDGMKVYPGIHSANQDRMRNSMQFSSQPQIQQPSEPVSTPLSLQSPQFPATSQSFSQPSIAQFSPQVAQAPQFPSPQMQTIQQVPMQLQASQFSSPPSQFMPQAAMPIFQQPAQQAQQAQPVQSPQQLHQSMRALSTASTAANYLKRSKDVIRQDSVERVARSSVTPGPLSPASPAADALKALKESDPEHQFLHSEEAKEMDKKDKRKMRNKLSARHFRERRKILLKTQEDTINRLQQKINALEAENGSMNKFLHHVMQYPAFHPHLEGFIRQLEGRPEPGLGNPEWN